MDVRNKDQASRADQRGDAGPESMAAQSLTENDIDGASLNGRHPSQLTDKDLKFWLACRGQQSSKLKTKAKLVAR